MTIEEWLTRGGSFDEGLALFQRSNRNRHILRYLIRKRDMDKLRYELEKIRKIRGDGRAPASRPVAAAEPTAERPDPDDGLPEKKTLDYRTLPDAIKPAYRKTVEIYRAMRSLHEKMKLVKSDSEREQVRDRLLTLDKERAAMWEIIDRWRQDGVLPNPSEDELLPSDPKSVAAARVSITRNLALLEKTTEQKRIDALVERLRRPVAIVKASGGTFTDKAGILSKYGLI